MMFLIRRVLLLCALFLSQTAYAQLEVHPRINVTEEYTDNLYLTDENEVDDWITTVQPGVNLAYDSRSADISLDYSLRYLFYADHSEQNIDEFEDVQRAQASAYFFKGRPFTLTATESIARETIDEQDTNAAYNDLINRTTVYHTHVSPEYRQRLTSIMSLVFGYDYDRTDYVSNRASDWYEHTGRVSFETQLSTHSLIAARYAYSIHNDENDFDDFDLQRYTLSLDQQVGKRVQLAVEGGLSRIDYDLGGREENLAFWLADLDVQLSGALSLHLNYNQDFEQTAEDGVTESQDAAFGLAYAKNDITALAELYWNRQDYLDLDREDIIRGFRTELTLPLTSVFSTSLDALYEHVKYENVAYDETAKRYEAGIALSAAYRRFLAALGYRYRHNNSDLVGRDYNNNLINLSISVVF